MKHRAMLRQPDNVMSIKCGDVMSRSALHTCRAGLLRRSLRSASSCLPLKGAVRASLRPSRPLRSLASTRLKARGGGSRLASCFRATGWAGSRAAPLALLGGGASKSESLLDELSLLLLSEDEESLPEDALLLSESSDDDDESLSEEEESELPAEWMPKIYNTTSILFEVQSGHSHAFSDSTCSLLQPFGSHLGVDWLLRAISQSMECNSEAGAHFAGQRPEQRAARQAAWAGQPGARAGHR